MCSVIEPDTSIRQNITAWATGFGMRVEPLVAHVQRIDVRDQAGAPLLAARVPLPARRGVASSSGVAKRRDLVAQRLQFFRLRPLQRDAARQRVPHRAVQRQVGRRSGHRIAGAMPDQRLGIRDLALREIGKFEVFQEQIDELVARQGEAEIVLALAVRAAFGAAAAVAAAAAAGWYRRRRIPCCRAADGREDRRCELRRNGGSCTPCAGRTTSPPSSASLMLRLPALSCTALRICDFARRMNRWRLARFFPLGFRRRSTMCIVCLLDLSGERPCIITPPASPAYTIPRAGAPAFPCSRAPSCDSTNSVCFFSVSPSFFEPKLITGSNSSTWLNIRLSITSRIFS